MDLHGSTHMEMSIAAERIQVFSFYGNISVFKNI
jgi:hypothetical protein